jgi:hypothetical protein
MCTTNANSTLKIKSYSRVEGDRQCLIAARNHAANGVNRNTTGYQRNKLPERVKTRKVGAIDSALSTGACHVQ